MTQKKDLKSKATAQVQSQVQAKPQSQAHAKPSDSELEILQVLWDKSKATVRDVHDEIVKLRDIGYTTTLKQMQRMQEKGLIIQTGFAGRSHVFEAVNIPNNTRTQLVDQLVKSAFGNSPSALVMHALGQQATKDKPSKSELDEIRALLDAIEDEA